jgi:hypothetical protein
MTVHLKETPWAQKASRLEKISFAAAGAVEGEYTF